MSAPDHEILSVETPFEGFFRVDRYRLRHRRFAGDWTPVLEREIFVRGHSVGVVPYDPRLDRILLVEQFRTAALVAGRSSPWTLEVPAGIIPAAGDAPEDVARRELREETGVVAGELIPLFRFMPSPGGSSEMVWLYAALVDLAEAGGLAGVAAEDEDIRIVVLEAGEALARLERGEIDNAITIMSLQWLALNRERLRRR
ncbi:MAG: NUDIX domain-containing protein [Alphaproteobacteria bacterium]|nr:NUDIX domain-containing protein [Alphaproteobacteria bacterium]